MQEVQVTGNLINSIGMPLQGNVEFVPSKIWVEEDGVAYPVPAPVVRLDDDGDFAATLIRTDQHGANWHYTVICPTARWSIFIDADGPLKLKNLVPKRYSA